jgi:hypothetical protein
VIGEAITLQPPAKALPRPEPCGRQIPLAQKSAREAEAISWIGDTPVYRKWKKQEPMRFLQKHKGATLQEQSTRSQNHEQSQPQRNTIEGFLLLPINDLQQSGTPNCRNRSEETSALLAMKRYERSPNKG